MKSNLKIVYMGTPEFAVAPLKALLQAGYNIPAVVTVPDRPKGRGLQMAPSDVKKFALEHNIAVLQPEKLRDTEFLAELEALDADLFIVVAFRMLPECVWKMPRLGTFNLHASLLPKYRGAAPINWQIINGEKESGVTTFFIDQQIDTGKILLQRKCPVEPRETLGTLHDKLMEMGAQLVLDTVKGLEENSIVPASQTEVSGEFAAPKIQKETCAINWGRTAQQIDAQVRGLSPYPGCTTTLIHEGEGTGFKIYKTEPAVQEQSTSDNQQPAATASTPGSIHTHDGRLFVQCADNLLEITELQQAGKKRMSASDFLRGYRYNIDKCVFK